MCREPVLQGRPRYQKGEVSRAGRTRERCFGSQRMKVRSKKPSCPGRASRARETRSELHARYHPPDSSLFRPCRARETRASGTEQLGTTKQGPPQRVGETVTSGNLGFFWALPSDTLGLSEGPAPAASRCPGLNICSTVLFGRDDDDNFSGADASPWLESGGAIPTLSVGSDAVCSAELLLGPRGNRRGAWDKASGGVVVWRKSAGALRGARAGRCRPWVWIHWPWNPGLRTRTST